MLLETVLLLASVHPAQPPKGVVSVPMLMAESKVPDIPAGYQSQFQALVIRQQKAQMELQNLVTQYQAAQTKLNNINSEALSLQEKMFKEMGIKSDEYHVQISDTGVLVVVHDPPKNADKKEEKK